MFRKLLKASVFFILLGFGLFSLISSSMSQGGEVWTNLNLYGGQIYDIAIDPCNPQKIFASSYMGDGLFMTVDGGSTWQTVETEHEIEGEDTFKNHAVYAVKIAPSNPNVILVVHNYWIEKSTDGGLTWAHIKNGTMQQFCSNCGGEDEGFRFCRSICVDPTDPNIVYVGTGGPMSTYASGAVYKSIDGGLTWKKSGFDGSKEFDYMVMDIDIDPQDTNIVWLVTSSEGYGGWDGTLYRSGDGGDTWKEIYAWEGLPASSGFSSIAVKPDDPNIIFTGSGFGIIRHYYDGNQWQMSMPLVESLFVRTISFAPQNPKIIYAAWRNPWFGDYLPRIARSTNGGIDWEDPFIIDYQFFTLAIHPENSEVIFGGDLNQGVYKSEDHGQTWNPLNNGINAVIIRDITINPNDSTHILAGTISGVYEKKADKAWSRLTTDSTRSILFHPASDKIFYAGITGHVKKTIDGGANWSLSNNLGNEFVQDIAIDPFDNETIFVAYGNLNGEIHKSIDGGDSFEKVLDGNNPAGDPYGFNAVAIDPSDPNHIFAGGGNFYAPMVNGALWESSDGGAYWTMTKLDNVIVNALLIDPFDPNIMYAGCGYSGGTDIPLYKSLDGGKTWKASFLGIPEEDITLYDIWGASSADVFTVGITGTILHYNGAWSPMESNTTEDLSGIWGSSSTDVFAVGNNGTILHYNGAWSCMESNTTEDLSGIWGSSSTDVFAVGNNGIILHYNGAWSPMESNTTEDLSGIWGSSSTDVFAMGANGAILHYNGAWSVMDSGTMENLWDIWGSSPNDVFAVGNNGAILHYNGAWSVMDSGTAENLRGVYGSSETDVFAVGWDGVVLHFDGKVWSPMDLGITRVSAKESLTDIWGSSGSDIFVIGGDGNIVHYNGRVWTILRSAGSWNAITDLAFHPRDRNIIYASTLAAGVYVSPNQGGYWMNLGTPEFNVFAIATSSLYAATEGGLWQCTGTGVISGQMIDGVFLSGIHGATVFNDIGIKSISINGEYMMVSPSGIFDVTAIANGFANETIENINVYGGDISWVNFVMQTGSSGSYALEDKNNSVDGRGSIGCFIAMVAQFL